MSERPRNTAGPGATRVRQTGIALVHEGEVVLPAAGSEVQAERVAQDDRTVVQYHFPVEIEVRAGGASIDTSRIIDLTLARLAQSLEAE
jgi:hypothetical protein